MRDSKTTPERVSVVRTLEKLPDPEPDWLDAPAVLARFDGWGPGEREVFIPSTTNPDHWTNTEWMFHWEELRDVTPLYPTEKETK